MANMSKIKEPTIFDQFKQDVGIKDRKKRAKMQLMSKMPEQQRQALLAKAQEAEVQEPAPQPQVQAPQQTAPQTSSMTQTALTAASQQAGGGAMGGAAQGAATGFSMGGPKGALIGAAIGGVMGGLQASAKRKAEIRKAKIAAEAAKAESLRVTEHNKAERISRALQGLSNTMSQNLGAF